MIPIPKSHSTAGTIIDQQDRLDIRRFNPDRTLLCVNHTVQWWNRGVVLLKIAISMRSNREPVMCDRDRHLLEVQR